MIGIFEILQFQRYAVAPLAVDFSFQEWKKKKLRLLKIGLRSNSFNCFDKINIIKTIEKDDGFWPTFHESTF